MKRKLLVLVASVLTTLSLVSVVAAQPERAGLLTGIPVTGDATGIDGTALEGLTGDFDGAVTITELRQVNGQLQGRGVLNGDATVNGEDIDVENQEFDWTDLTLGTEGPGRSCPILLLEIDRIFLDVLGLIVEVDPIVIDVRAERGPGRLLGNLLCALLGALDRGHEGAIQDRVNQINDLL